MQPLVFDVTRALGRTLKGRLPTGVDRVTLQYLKHFGHAAHALIRIGAYWRVLNLAHSSAVFQHLQNPDTVSRFSLLVTLVKALFTPRVSLSASYLLNLGHSGLHSKNYAKKLTALGLRGIYFLHDLIPITHPEYCRAFEAEKHHIRLQTMLKTGKAILVNSQATAQELTVYAQAKNLPLPPLAVAWLAPAPLPQAQSEAPKTPPYFVLLGTIEPRKNHLLILQLWRQLAEHYGQNTPHLVIVGQYGWECEQVADLLERCEQIRAYVRHEPRCSDAQLTQHLSHARALLFPSFTEGYGMPLVEALAAGLPVIASDLPIFREIAGNIPEYLDPLDGLGWMRAIEAYATPDSPQRQQQIERMQGWHAPTWEQHFDGVTEFFARVL